MKKAIVILLAGMACVMLIAAGCTGTSKTTAVTTTAATAVTTTTAAESSPTLTMTTAGPADMSASAQATPSWDGTWNTSYSMAGSSDVIERLVLTQSGSTVNGTYGKDKCPITGTVQDNKVTGTWNETDTTGAYSGFFMFEKSADDKSFEGKWVYTSEGADTLENTTQYWNGVRV